MSTVKLSKPYKKARPYLDPYLLKGYKQREHINWEHTNDGGTGTTATGNRVAVVGRNSLAPHTYNSAQDLSYAVTFALCRKIFKREFNVDIVDENQPMYDLFPFEHRTHVDSTTGTNQQLVINPHGGFFGIEWIVKIDVPQLGATGTLASTMPSHKIPVYRGCGITPKYYNSNDGGWALWQLSLNATQYNQTLDTGTFAWTVKDFVVNATDKLSYFTGNPQAGNRIGTTLGTNNSPSRTGYYDASVFRYLTEGLDRNYTADRINSNAYDTNSYANTDVSLYGYRVIYYDTDNTSVSAIKENDWAYRVGQIKRLDNLKISAAETANITIRNMTLGDSGTNADMNGTIDSNPIKGKMYYYSEPPVLDVTPKIQNIRANNIQTGAPSMGVLQGQDTHYTSEVPDGNVLLSTARPSYHWFSPPNNKSIIYRETTPYANPTVPMPISLHTCPPPYWHKNCKYTDVYMKPGQAITFTQAFKFSGYLWKFYKNINLYGQVGDAPAGTNYTTYPTWTDINGTTTVLALERARTNKLEGPPNLEVNITVKRKAITTTTKKVFLNQPDLGTDYTQAPLSF